MKRRAGNWLIVTGDDVEPTGDTRLEFVDGYLRVRGRSAWAALAVLGGFLFALGMILG